MISLKKYLELDSTRAGATASSESKDLLTVLREAYRAALLEMGSCSVAACPASGAGLMESLTAMSEELPVIAKPEGVQAIGEKVRAALEGWGLLTARNSQLKTREVKELLLVLALAAESVGERDQRCAGQISEVTSRLKGIASLDDLGEIRASIERSAAELKSSVERMTSESKQAIDKLKAEVTVYQARVKEAEELTSRDLLTGVRSRLYAESHIESRLSLGAPFCVAVIDINGFKRVNDNLGHLAGDELLKQFATELTSACRSTDVIARWGGDEFILVLDLSLDKAVAQMDRTRKWVFGDYSVATGSGTQKLKVTASIGLAERKPGDSMKDIVGRADAEMYVDKAASRAAGTRSER